jgi:phage terminase large subunit-like protein
MGRKKKLDDLPPGEKALERVLNFFRSCIVQVDGPNKGNPLKILPWQMEHIFQPVFGRVDHEGYRLIRHCHLDIAKKNGKSGLASGLAHYLAWGDGEPSARVAVCASDKYQGRVVFADCQKMVELSPTLSHVCTVYKDKIFGPNDSSIELLSADVKSKHGPKFSAIIQDEVHAFPGTGYEMHDVLAPSIVNRDNPLILTMTTAGKNSIHFWHDLRERALAKMKNPKSDPAFHGVVFTTDPKDDIFDEATWKKANPSYGTILNKRYFAQMAEESRHDKKKEALFRWLHLNQMVSELVSYIPMETWDSCLFDPALFEVT